MVSDAVVPGELSSTKDHHELIPELIERIKSLTISSLPATKDPFMGPIVLPEIKNELLTQSFKQSETLLKSSNLGPGGLISPRIEINRPSTRH